VDVLLVLFVVRGVRLLLPPLFWERERVCTVGWWLWLINSVVCGRERIEDSRHGRGVGWWWLQYG